MAGLSIDVRISDSDMFEDIASFLAELDSEHPELGIAAKIDTICEKHKSKS